MTKNMWEEHIKKFLRSINNLYFYNNTLCLITLNKGNCNTCVASMDKDIDINNRVCRSLPMCWIGSKLTDRKIELHASYIQIRVYKKAVNKRRK